MQRTPIDSYEAQHSPRNERDYEPVANRCWRTTASLHLLCHGWKTVSPALYACKLRQMLEGIRTKRRFAPQITWADVRLPDYMSTEVSRLQNTLRPPAHRPRGRLSPRASSQCQNVC